MFMICELVLRVGLPFYSETHKPDLTACTVGSRKIFIGQLNNSKEIENSRFRFVKYLNQNRSLFSFCFISKSIFKWMGMIKT